MRAVDIIRAKRDGQALEARAIDAFVAGTTDGSWGEGQLAALLMAIVLQGMTPDETAQLTDAMVRSGRRVDLGSVPGPKVGKHSTGGVGDKVSIILAPLVAACGVVVPKMSGRGLGHTGGTLDKLESIPGFRVEMGVDGFLAALREVGCAIIGQTADIAPADRVLYALRDVTATIDSIPLIAASIMSKKLAEGSPALVLDVKCGRGAFMRTRPEARALARALVDIGTARGVRTEALITAMDVPLGRAVGNALEIRECVDVLRGRGPDDLRALVARLAARMLQLAGAADTDGAADARVAEALVSGAALDRLRAMIARQGGDARVVDEPERLPQATHVETVAAPVAGIVTDIDAEAIGRAAVLLGAGRERRGETVDPAAGVRLCRVPGEPVTAGAPLAELHASDPGRMEATRALVAGAFTIGRTPPPSRPLVYARVDRDGETTFV